jgi:hypothetical protein
MQEGTCSVDMIPHILAWVVSSQDAAHVGAMRAARDMYGQHCTTACHVISVSKDSTIE